jgi:hypothetical protein
MMILVTLMTQLVCRRWSDDNDELNRAVPAGKPKDWRRTQLLNYFDEVPIAE